MPTRAKTRQVSPPADLDGHPDELGDQQPDDRPAVPVPTFQPPTTGPANPRRRPQDPPPPETTPSPGGIGSGSAGEAPETASTASTDDPKRPFRPFGALDKASIAAYARVAGVVFTAIGGLLNDRLAVDDTDDVWLPHDQDVDNVSEPVGRIAARHAPIKGDSASDVGDAVTAIAGLAVYVVGNLGKMRVRRRRARAMTRGAVVAPADETPAEPPPPPPPPVVEDPVEDIVPGPSVAPSVLAAASGFGGV